MRYMLAALPVVGLFIGLFLIGWFRLCALLGFQSILFAAGVTLLPVLVTGGIHMDGYCDTVDALSSHAEPARKLAILHDPHPGAFAVVFTVVWLLSYFALATQLAGNMQTALLLLALHVMSRIMGGFAALSFPLAGSGGMLAMMQGAASTRPAKAILAVAFILCTAAMAWLSLPVGGGMTVTAVLCTLAVRRMAMRQFGGMRGDIVGYLIAVCELAMLAAMVLLEGVLSL